MRALLLAVLFTASMVGTAGAQEIQTATVGPSEQIGPVQFVVRTGLFSSGVPVAFLELMSEEESLEEISANGVNDPSQAASTEVEAIFAFDSVTDFIAWYEGPAAQAILSNLSEMSRGQSVRYALRAQR